MRKLRVPFLLAAAAGLVAATVATAGDSTVATTYGIKVYEVFQRGASVELQARTTRAFEPNHVRNVAIGEVFPPTGEPAMRVYKSRDHLAFVGSFWREDGSSVDFGKYQVEIMDEGPTEEAGVEMIRVKIVPREAGKQAARRNFHPEFQAKRDAKDAAEAPSKN